MSLQHFRSDQVILTNQEAWQILIFFFGGNAGAVPGWMTAEDRAFAQALLLEAIERSAQMSWVEALFREAMKPNVSAGKIIKALARHAAKSFWRRLQPQDYTNPKIYQMIHSQLARNWRSVWRIRIDTGEPVAY